VTYSNVALRREGLGEKKLINCLGFLLYGNHGKALAVCGLRFSSASVRQVQKNMEIGVALHSSHNRANTCRFLNSFDWFQIHISTKQSLLEPFDRFSSVFLSCRYVVNGIYSPSEEESTIRALISANLFGVFDELDASKRAMAIYDTYVEDIIWYEGSDGII